MPTPVTNVGKLRINDLHLLWLGVFLLCTAFQLAGMVPDMRYDRRLVSDSQWWLLFTGQLVHLDWPHWFLNMAGIGIVAFFFSNIGKLSEWLLVFLVSATFVGVGLHLHNPEIITYVGLSGVLHALFMYGAILETRRYPLSGYVMIVVLVAKLTWEVFYGVMPYTQEMTSGKVVTDSHLYGGIGGAAGFVCIYLLQKLKQLMTD